MGRIEKGAKCSVSGCSNLAARSLATERATRAGLNLESSRRAYLCRDHYKEFKKKSQKDRLLERWRMMK